jgi:hypothetical protein
MAGVLIAQENAPPPAETTPPASAPQPPAAPPASEPAATPPAGAEASESVPPIETDDVFIPTQELGADEQVTFPVDI